MSGRVVFSLLVAAILCGALTRFQHDASTVPPYVAFDMDLVITVDSFLMGSGRIPDNLGHPGFGLNLLLSKSQALAYSVGGLGARDIAGLASALNPLLPAIEMTAFNRAHSPLVALVIVASLWAGLAIGLRWRPWFAVLALLTLSSQQGLIYQAMGVRSELYALLYWSLGMLAIAIAARARTQRATLIWAALAGFALGISFFTKIQVMFYLLGAGLFLYLLLWVRTGPPRLYPDRLGPALSASSLGLLVLGLWGAWAVEPEKGSATFASGFTLTPPALALLALLVALTAIQLRTREQQQLLVPTSALVLGFLLSSAAHLVMFRDLATSWRYMLLDLKIVYLRPDYYGGKGFQTIWGYMGRLATVTLQNPALMASLVGLLWLAVWLHRKDKARVALLLGIGGTALLSIAMGSRERDLDWIWVELFPTAVTLLAASLLVRAKERPLRWLAGAAILVLALSNLNLASSMARRYRDSQATYGYRPWRFSRAVFAASFPLYTEPFDLRYKKAGWRAFSASLSQMAHLNEVLMMADAVTGSADPLSVGPVVTGLPVWKEEPEWLLTTATPSLANALVIDPPAQPTLSMRMRTDLAVYVLLDGPHYQALTGQAPAPAGERLELGKGSSTAILYPVRLDKATDFSEQQLGASALVLVKPLIELTNPTLPPEPQW